MTFLFEAPVSHEAAVGVGFLAGFYTLITTIAVAILFKNRHSRIVTVRSLFLMGVAVFYGTFTVVATCANYILGKNETTCQVMGVAYTFFNPFYSFTYMLNYPTIVFADVLNALKEERANGIRNWKWMFHGVFSFKMKLIYIVCAVLLQLVVYLILRFAFPDLPGGESGFDPAGEEVNCFRRELLSSSITGILFFNLLGMFVMKAAMIDDPYYLRVEVFPLMFCLTPLTFVCMIYSFAPQIFTANFDFRFIPIILTLSGFFSTVVPVTFLSFKSFEEYVERSSRRFRAWRSGERLHDKLEMEDASNEAILALQEGSDVFKIVLDHPILLEAFVQYTTKDWCVENVLFYKDVEQFNNSFAAATPEGRLEKANKIVNEFVMNGAPMEINIEHAPRQLLIKKVRQGNIEENMFQKAQKHIFELMKKDTFNKWQKTVEYKNALKRAVQSRQYSSSSQLEFVKNDQLRHVTLTVTQKDDGN